MNFVDFEELSGRIFPIAYRQTKTDPVFCPYCDKHHTHGIDDGHRASHCSTLVPTRKLYPTSQSQPLEPFDGYIVKTLNP